jgi:hypothetical protein
MFLVTVTLNDWSVQAAPVRSRHVAEALARIISEGNTVAKVSVTESGAAEAICIYQNGARIYPATDRPAAGNGR